MSFRLDKLFRDLIDTSKEDVEDAQEKVKQETSNAWDAIQGLVALVGLGVAGHQAVQGRRGAKQARRQQEAAQVQARGRAARQARENEMATNRANRRRPNVAAIIASAMQGSRRGIGRTMLTGPNGIEPLGGGGTERLG